MIIPKLLTGLMPMMLGTHTLRIESGVAAVSGMNPDYLAKIDTNTDLDITQVGPWGLDRSLWVGWAYLWLIADSNDVNSPAVILSPSALGGGLILPSGYDRIRYLPYAVYLEGSSAGMRKQVVTAWHSPCMTMYQDQGPDHEISAGPTNGNWESVSLTDLMPTDARVAHLLVTSEVAYGAGGSVWVRTPNSGDGGFPVKANQETYRPVCVSSNENIEVRTSTAARAKLRVIGYSIQTTY